MAIVVSHIGEDFDLLGRQALRQAPLADLIELRLDHIGHPGEERLRELIGRAPKPVIVSMHGPESLGHYAGDLDVKLEALHAAARAGAMFVDVDWRLSLELGPMEGKCHRIVSRHEGDATPGDLAALEEEVRAVLHEGDAVKLVTHARHAEDGLRMLRHLRAARGGLIAFCSGERGRFTRVLCTLFGSPFTYAAAARIPGQPEPAATAPGQIRANDLRGMLPPGGLHPGTAVFAVVGASVEGSLSPHVHDMALKMARLDAVYLGLSAEDLEQALALADDPCFRGFSVTAPHKQAAFRLARASDAESRATRASNTLVREGEGWRAANTDVPAVRETLEKAWTYHRQRSGRPYVAQGSGLAGVHALVLGAGGAARAVVHAVRSSGGRATLAARSHEKARAVAAELECAAIPWEAIPATAHDILVNATPLGGRGRPAGEPEAPVPADWVREGILVLDAVYDPVRTPLLEAARARGCTPVPGAEWFVRQAAAQFQLFTRQEPDESVLRSALEKALAPDADASRRPVWALVGLRASGKSSVGRELARLRGCPWLDLDEVLAREHGATGAGELLRARGVEAFRALEARALAEALDPQRPLVLSTGGGVVETPACRAWLAERTWCVWLREEIGVLQRRIAADAADRPPLVGEDPAAELPALACRREPLYQQASHLGLEGRGRPPGDLAREILELAREPLGRA